MLLHLRLASFKYVWYPQRGERRMRRGERTAGRIKDKDQLLFLKPGLPEDMLFWLKRLVILVHESVAFTLCMKKYDKPYATLKKVLQHRKHNGTKDCVRNNEWESSSGSLGCKNVCNVSFQKKSKIVEVWSIAQKQEIGWQQSDSPLLHCATVFLLKMNKQDNLPTTKCQTTLLEQLHKNISLFNVPNWNIFSLRPKS